MDYFNAFVEFEATDEKFIRQIKGFIICPEYKKNDLYPVHPREWGLIKNENGMKIRFLCAIKQWDEGKVKVNNNLDDQFRK